METWDLVKLYARAMRSKHYVEAMCFGYQNLEYILEILLTRTTVGGAGKAPDPEVVRKARYLISKADLALKHDFIDAQLHQEILAFNRLRADIIHNAAKKDLKPEDLEVCAKMVAPLYKRIQDIFLTIRVSQPENV